MSKPKKDPVVFEVQVFFEKEEGGGFHTYVPSLKGLHSCGETIAEAKKNTVSAIAAYLTSLMKHHEPIPLTCLHTPEEHRARSARSVMDRQELLQVNV